MTAMAFVELVPGEWLANTLLAILADKFIEYLRNEKNYFTLQFSL